PGAVHRQVELGDRGGRAQWRQLFGEDRGCLGVAGRRERPCRRLRRTVPPVWPESSTPVSSASRSRAFANGAAAPRRATIARSPPDSDAWATPSSSSRGTTSDRQSLGVVVGAATLDRTEHRIERLGPVGDEPGLVSRPAAKVGTAVAGIGGQQPLK
ncbi:MAG: hypothetical protein ACYDDW_20130, partial [Dermatophilaceae bacterium]